MRQTGSREIDSSRQESRQPSWRWTIARAVQQRPELGDLVAGGVHVGLAQDRAGRVVHDRQQMHRRGPATATAARGLAVDRDRPPPRPSRRWWPLVGQPPADHPVQRVRVNAGQHAADGGLGKWPPDPAQRVAARPKRGQHWPGCVSGPFANRGQGSGTGQYRGDRHGQHRAECVPPATAVAWVGDLAEVVEQATALVGCEHDRGVQPLGGCRYRGMMRGQARRSEGIMGFDTRMIATGRLRQRSWETPRATSARSLRSRPTRSAPPSSGPRPKSSGPASAATGDRAQGRDREAARGGDFNDAPPV
jgi:hypothetical protein